MMSIGSGGQRRPGLEGVGLIVKVPVTAKNHRLDRVAKLAIARDVDVVEADSLVRTESRLESAHLVDGESDPGVLVKKRSINPAASASPVLESVVLHQGVESVGGVELFVLVQLEPGFGVVNEAGELRDLLDIEMHGLVVLGADEGPANLARSRGDDYALLETELIAHVRDEGVVGCEKLRSEGILLRRIDYPLLQILRLLLKLEAPEAILQGLLQHVVVHLISLKM